MPESELAIPYLESGQYVIEKSKHAKRAHLDELQFFVIYKDNCQLHCQRFLVAHIVIPFCDVSFLGKKTHKNNFGGSP